MNELHMTPSSASPPEPSSDLQTELKDTKVPTNGCWARRADVHVLFTQWKQINSWACIEMLVRSVWLINLTQILRNKNPDDLEYLSEYVIGSGSHVQYCHARQLKLLCRKYPTITQPRAKQKTKKSARRNLVHGAKIDCQCFSRPCTATNRLADRLANGSYTQRIVKVRK